MDIFGKKRIAELENELDKVRWSKQTIEKKADEYRWSIESLNDEIKSLTNEINAKVADCKVGVWCEECKYHKTTKLGNIDMMDECAINPWIEYNRKYDRYYYCSKHLREICPEFEKDE